MPNPYPYSIANDTANGTLAQEKLHDEIAASSITISLTGVNVSGDSISIEFATDISAGEETTLDGIIAAHDGIPGPDDPKSVYIPQDKPIHQFALKEADNLRARLIGIQNNATATKTTTTNIDWKIPQVTYQGQNKQTYMDGIQYKATNAVDGDRMHFQVVDIDNIFGYGAGLVLDEFGCDWPVAYDKTDVIRLYKAKLVPGLYIRIVYISIGTVDDVKLNVGLFRHMDTTINI